MKKKCNKLDIEFIQTEIISYIETYGAFFKHSSFKNECEYRILIKINADNVHSDKKYYAGINNKKMESNFNIKNGLIVPCMEISFNFDSISKIIIPPVMEQKLAEIGIKDLISKINKNSKIKIENSKIPVRF